MVKLLLSLLAALSIQCSKPHEQTLQAEIPVAVSDSSWDWIGHYYSGDGEFIGVSLDLEELGIFSATSFSCTSKSFTMEGTWVSQNGWIEFTADSWDEDIDFSLPRMKMLRWKEELLLLPQGDESLLEKELYRSNEVFSKGASEDRERYFDKVFES